MMCFSDVFPFSLHRVHELGWGWKQQGMGGGWVGHYEKGGDNIGGSSWLGGGG